jgi:hypothetical protein
LDTEQSSELFQQFKILLNNEGVVSLP